MTSSTISSKQNFSIELNSFKLSSTLLTLSSRWVPALPGQTKTCFTISSCAHFQAKACSLPPEPIIRTFISVENASFQ